MSPRPRVLLATTLTLAVVLALAPDAFAAASSGGASIGKNLGDLLGTWAKSLFSGVAALVSIAFLFGRRYNELALFCVAALVVGGLIFAAPTVANVIRAIWTTLGGA